MVATSSTSSIQEKAGSVFLIFQGRTLGQHEIYGTLFPELNSKEIVPKDPLRFCKFTAFIFLNGIEIKKDKAAPLLIITLFSVIIYTELWACIPARAVSYTHLTLPTTPYV